MKDVELFIVVGSIVSLLFIAFIISFLLVNQRRHFRYIKERQRLQNEFEQTLLQSQLEIQEQTLQHISRELHDNLGQIASLIKINLNTLKLEDLPTATSKIEDTKELVRQLITDLKMLSVSLGSDRVNQLGLQKSLQIEVDRLNKTGHFIAHFSGPTDTIPLEINKTTILYRMAQEVLNNIVKHSGASHIDVTLHTKPNFVILVFSDNGSGFDPALKSNTDSAGILNLQNRAKLINAELVIDSKPGTGTNVTISLPY